MQETFEFARDWGTANEADFPYAAVDDQPCSYDPYNPNQLVHPTGYTDVIPNNAFALKVAIASGPVSVYIQASSFVFQFYSDGVLNSSKCGTDLNHGVTAIGYGEDYSGEYFIVRNSWGTGWGLKGYVNIAIEDGPGICGIQIQPTYPTF